jgi:hypothetical protein
MTREPLALTTAQAEALTLDTEPWLSCEDCFDLMDAHVDALVDDETAVAPPGLAAHLRGCAACAEEVDSRLDLVRADRP